MKSIQRKAARGLSQQLHHSTSAGRGAACAQGDVHNHVLLASLSVSTAQVMSNALL